MFNRGAVETVVPLEGGAACHVFDDALTDPRRVVAAAEANRSRFVPSGHNAYPGVELRMSDAFSAELDAFFALRVRRQLGGRRTLRAYSRLSMVTLRPDQLSPLQSIPHRDRMELEPGRCVAACVLYLFDDAALGGTGFYRPARPPAEMAALLQDASLLDGEAFGRRHGVPCGYQTASSPWFEKIGSVPARFNRLIFYNGMQFHSGDILLPERLTDDPKTGRLTLNGFFTCRALAEPDWQPSGPAVATDRP